MNTDLHHHVWRFMLVGLLLVTSITTNNSSGLQAKTVSRKQVYSSGSAQKLSFGGQLRTYYLHIPKSYSPEQPAPLVLVFHGSGGSGRTIASVTGFNDLADTKGFVVVYPNAIDHIWNDQQDIPFVAALIEHLSQSVNIDTSRIYATGFSSGGIFIQALACQLSNQIAAFATVAATFTRGVAYNCQPDNPVSMLMINGTGDRDVPYRGGSDGEFVPVPKTIELWRRYSGCGAKAKIEYDSGLKISRYRHCRGGAEVMLVSIIHGGHRWPDGDAIDATSAIWNFFRRHS